MCFYRFVNSKGVADHLHETGYKFTDATLDEKIAAWLEIAEAMLNCPMEGLLNTCPVPSFHAFLHDYVDLQKRELYGLLTEGILSRRDLGQGSARRESPGLGYSMA